MLLNSYSNRLDQSVSQLTIPIQFPDIKKSRPQVSCEKTLLKQFAKLTQKHLRWSFPVNLQIILEKRLYRTPVNGYIQRVTKIQGYCNNNNKIIIRLTFTLITGNSQMVAAYGGRFFIQRGIFFIFPYISPDIYVTFAEKTVESGSLMELPPQ